MLILAEAAVLLSLLSYPWPVTPPERMSVVERLQLADHWDDLDDEKRERARRNYNVYQNLRDDERRHIDERYEKWKKLPQSDQERYRKKHDEYRRKHSRDDY